MPQIPAPFSFETAANGVGTLRCAALPVPHGFSTRLGGHSQGPFAGFNLGASAGDDEAALRANRALWAAALGVEGPIAGMHQVHGAVVHAVTGPPAETLYGDGIASDRPGLAIGVYTADCTPILLHDPDSGAVGAAHAGWRGTVAGVGAETVKLMAARYGAKPERIVAAIGPAIGPCCFEVGEEVPAAFRAAGWAGVAGALIERAGAKPHVDLFEANRSQLVALGLAPAKVHVSGLCTACHADWFFSWRRDAGKTGRMHSAIAVAGP